MTADTDAPLARDDANVDAGERLQPLFAHDREDELRARWHALQARFVDEPKETVSDADSLVAELLRDLAQSFEQSRSRLEAQWASGEEDASTEDLRILLQRYRSFFERLLTV